MALNYYFVPIPNSVIEAMLTSRLTGGQLKVLLWLIRRTIGWNKTWVSVTWYRIAKELGLERSRVRRDAQGLIEKGVVIRDGQELRIEADPTRWSPELRRPGTEAAAPRNRGILAPVVRRSKDIHQDNLKTVATRNQSEYHPAGSARPVPGKYDNL
jgi:phage replication O-like protein O